MFGLFKKREGIPPKETAGETYTEKMRNWAQDTINAASREDFDDVKNYVIGEIAAASDTMKQSGNAEVQNQAGELFQLINEVQGMDFEPIAPPMTLEEDRAPNTTIYPQPVSSETALPTNVPESMKDMVADLPESAPAARTGIIHHEHIGDSETEDIEDELTEQIPGRENPHAKSA